MTRPPQGPDGSLSAKVADEIRAWLGRRRMSQAQLARELGVSAPWVSYRLGGTQPIDLNDMERICAVLDVDVVTVLSNAVDAAGMAATNRHVVGGSPFRVRSSQPLDGPSRPSEGCRPGRPTADGKRGPGRRQKRRLSIA